MLIPILGVGGLVYYVNNHGSGAGTHSVSLPASIGGVPKNADARLATIATQMQASASRATGVTQAVAGFYGQQAGGNPQFAILLIAESGTVGRTDLNAFAGGLNGAAGTNAFDASTATSQTDNGVDFRCGPLTIAGQTGSVCVWADGNVTGAVMGYPGAGAAGTLAEAEAARATAEH